MQPSGAIVAVPAPGKPSFFSAVSPFLPGFRVRDGRRGAGKTIGGKVLPIAVGVGLCLWSPAWAGAAPNGREFQVNSYAAGEQVGVSLGMDGDGDFVAVWDSYAQDGSKHGVFGQMFDSAGGKVGAEFQVNTYTTESQADAAVGVDHNGDFVVVWESRGQDGSQAGVFGQRFDSAGLAVGGEFQVNTFTTNNQMAPAVGMSDNGDFVVAWTSWTQDGSSLGVFGQMFDSAGLAVGGEFQVNTYTSGNQGTAAVGMDSGGSFLVAWVTDQHAVPGVNIIARMFDSAGGAVGGEFMVNTHTSGSKDTPAIGMNGYGDFVVSWTSDGQDGSGSGIFAQRYDRLGYAMGAEFQVNTFATGYQYLPAVVMDGHGDFVVSWDSYDQRGSDWDIFAQRVLTNGPALTSPLPGGTVDCSSPALSRPTFTWEMGDYDRFKVFMGSSAEFRKRTRVTSGKKKITSDSWMPSKKKWKRACNKAINQAADPNNPAMYVAVWGVDRDLRKKDPMRKLFSFVVRTEVQP